MEHPETLALQALAMRRQLAMLAHETLTTERLLVINVILQLSYDVGRLEAPLPSQARLAFICGLDKGDVSRAEKSLIDCGLLRMRGGLDGWRLYEPRPDVREWQGVRWRIAERAQRAQVLSDLAWLSSSHGPGDPQQTHLGIQVEPTIAQEYQASVAEIARADALRDAVPAVTPERMIYSSGNQAAAIPSGETAQSSRPVPGNRDWAALKAGLRSGSVGRVANEAAAAGKPSLAGQPTPPLGNQGALARQPTERWPGSQRPSPESGEALAVQPTAGSRAPSRDKLPSSISPSQSPQRSSSISPSETGKMENAASVAVGDGQTADPETWGRIVAVIGSHQAKEWARWWRRELRPPGRWTAAQEALGDLKIQLDLIEAGIRRDPINTPGAWFVNKFCELGQVTRKGAR